MKPLRILIMEDEPVLAMLLAQVLEEMGHTICGNVDTEAAAVAAAARCEPEMMIIDGRLRRGSGHAALDVILRNGFVPHIFVTGDDASLRSLRPKAIIIRKPFQETDLVEAMELALDRAAMTTPAAPI